MKYELKTIGVWSFTKIAFFVNLAMGVLVGLFAAMIFGFVMTVASVLPPEFSELGNEPQSLGFLVVLLPIFYGLMSAVIGTIMCVILVLVYNLMAKAVGGLELTFEAVQDQWQQPPPPAPGPHYAQQQVGQQPAQVPPASRPIDPPPPPRQAPPRSNEPPQHDDTRRPDDQGSFGPQQG